MSIEGNIAQRPRQGEPGDVHVLGLLGSERSDSLNLRLLRSAGSVEASFELTIFKSAAGEPIPPFNPDADFPDGVARLREAVEEADAVLLATPEYNGSLPGGLKNAIDWVSTPAGEGPIRGKPTAVIGADRGEVGCDWAHADARKVLETAGARVIRDGLSVCDAENAFDDAGHLVEPTQALRLEQVVEELVEESRGP